MNARKVLRYSAPFACGAVLAVVGGIAGADGHQFASGMFQVAAFLFGVWGLFQ